MIIDLTLFKNLKDSLKVFGYFSENSNTKIDTLCFQLLKLWRLLLRPLEKILIIFLMSLEVFFARIGVIRVFGECLGRGFLKPRIFLDSVKRKELEEYFS